MRKTLSLLLFFAAAGCVAQSRVIIQGRITNTDGTAVEYATIGIPGKGSGTLSSADGTFILDTEACGSDTLVVSHVSYEEIKVTVNELLDMAGNVVMKARELREAVVYSGKRKKAVLAGKGMKIPGAATMFTIANKGCEIGSMVEAERVFELHEISFKVRSNSITGARFSVNIYKENEQTGEFNNTLCKPIYLDIPVNAGKQEITVEVKERVAIEPSRYFVSLMFVDYKNADKTAHTGRIYFPLYLKSSCTRKGVMHSLEQIPVNMGLSLKGVEYR